MFIEAFHYSEDAGNILEVYLTNLKIAKQRILEFKLEGEPKNVTNVHIEIKKPESIVLGATQSEAKVKSKIEESKGEKEYFSSDSGDERMDYMLQNLEHHQSSYLR